MVDSIGRKSFSSGSTGKTGRKHLGHNVSFAECGKLNASGMGNIGKVGFGRGIRKTIVRRDKERLRFLLQRNENKIKRRLNTSKREIRR